MVNALDLVILGTIVLFAIVGYKRGLVLTVYRFLSLLIALFLAFMLHPLITRFLRDSPIYEFIRGRIARSTNFENAFTNNGSYPSVGDTTRDINIIDRLPLPQSIRDMLYNNNTPDMHELLRVNTMEEYVSGFFANIVINVLALVIVLVAVLIGMYFIGKTLKIINYIPLISSINKFGGLAAGVFIGVIVMWLGLTVITMLFSVRGNETLADLLQGSATARWMFDTGRLLNRITSV